MEKASKEKAWRRLKSALLVLAMRAIRTKRRVGDVASDSMECHKAALADYIAVLEKSARETDRAEDRSRYQQHLASAALMYAAIAKQCSLEGLRELVASERHSYGWSFLSGPPGEAAETAFDQFAKLVESD